MCESERMKRLLLTSFLIMACVPGLSSQVTVVKGRIIDRDSNLPVVGAEITLDEKSFKAVSDDNGSFEIAGPLKFQGPQSMLVEKAGYVAQRIQIVIDDTLPLELGNVLLQYDIAEAEKQIGIISLADNQLEPDQGIAYNTSGLLQSERDVFLNAAAFDFSAAFFRPRGYGNTDAKVLINGVEMNGLYDGRPQWASWGGLNDVQRIREFSLGLRPNEYTFGDLGGTTNIVMRPSHYRKGARISFALSNRTYQGRIMGSYHSGVNQKGWALSALLSRRFGKQGFVEGTSYNANSFFIAVEKEWDRKNSLNLLFLYTPNHRGRSTPLTAEALAIKGSSYNPLWGYHNELVRNSRIRRTEKPLLMLSHNWKLGTNTDLNSSIAYQFGSAADSRLESSGQRNPLANFYQRMPSYFLRNPDPGPYDFQLSYLAGQELRVNGQLDWDALYRANTAAQSGRASFIVYDDVRAQRQTAFNGTLFSRLSPSFTLNAAMAYTHSTNEHYARINDLLGGQGYLDIDYFGTDPQKIQNDLQNPNRIAGAGDRFRYNYELNSSVISAFVQGQLDGRDLDLHLAVMAGQTRHQRKGLFQNGYFNESGRSLGESDPAVFPDFGIKAGGIYSINGRHQIELNTAYFTKAPSARQSFASIRQNNDLVSGLKSEARKAVDLSYLYRSPRLQLRLTGYYSTFTDQVDIGFYFTQNALGNEDNNAFVQEIVTGIDKQNTGVEFAVQSEIYPGLKLKAAASYGSLIYSDDALLYLAGDDFDDTRTPDIHEGNDLFNRGKRMVSLTGYHQAAGPQLACQFGLDYRSSSYWWLGASVNYFDRIYVDISKLRRTPDFFLDSDGYPFNDIDQKVARRLLRQERLSDYFLLNAVAGKSWRFGRYILGFFTAVTNLLGQEYLSGGFEDSRRSGYRQQLEEQGRPFGPLFGNRYFPGYGTTFYLNIYIRY